MKNKKVQDKEPEKNIQKKEVVYIKVEPKLALESKRAMLEAQLSLLNSIRHKENYSSIRRENIKLKVKLLELILKIKTDLNKLSEIIPKIRSEKVSIERPIEIKSERGALSIEERLLRIKEKLSNY